MVEGLHTFADAVKVGDSLLSRAYQVRLQFPIP